MSLWSRRQFGSLALGAAAAGCAPMDNPFGPQLPPPVLPAPGQSLNDLARAKGMRFGSAMNHFELRDPGMCAIMKAECGIMVTENELKWPQIQPAPDTFTFANGDAMAAFAKANGLLLRGHNLVWQKPKYMPAWVLNADFGTDPAQAAKDMLRKHITTEMKHYPQVVSWDVVNETIDTDTGEVRDTVFTKALGPEGLFDFVYHVARDTAPGAQLVYNDYMSWETYSAKHRAGVLRFLEKMKAKGVPIDALGVQGHIGANNNYVAKDFGVSQETEWRKFLDEVTGMGYALLVTEFDVNDNGLPADIAARDKQVADYAKAYLDITLSYKQVGSVLTWGIVDSHSWLQRFTKRPDGLPLRPLPYDPDYKPTPLRDAMAAAFMAAPAR